MISLSPFALAFAVAVSAAPARKPVHHRKAAAPAAVAVSSGTAPAKVEPFADFQSRLEAVRTALEKEGPAAAAARLKGLDVPPSLQGADRSRAFQSRSDLLKRLGRDQDALDDLRAAASAEPENVALVRALAVDLLASGRAAEALVYADYVCREQPESWSKTERAASLVLRGRVELALERVDAAQRDLSDALKLSPGEAEGLAAMTDVWLKRGRPAKGLTYADRLVDAQRAAAPAARAQAFERRAALRTARGEDAKAEADLKAALAAEPSSASARKALAACLLKQGRTADAVEYSSGAARALLELKLGDPARSEASLQALLRTSPDDADALDAMVSVLGQLNRSTDALVYADRALEASKTAPPAVQARRLLERAKLRLALKSYAPAAADLAAAAKLDASLVDARLLLAVALDRQSDFKAALESIDATVAASTSSAALAARVLTARFVIALDSGDKDSGAASLKKAAALDARETCLVGPSFVARSDLDLSYFDACVAALPKEETLLTDRGVARYLKGQRDGAVADWTEALKRNPGDLPAAMSLAAALQEGLKLDQARAVLDKALAAASGRKDERSYKEASAARGALGPRP